MDSDDDDDDITSLLYKLCVTNGDAIQVGACFHLTKE